MAAIAQARATDRPGRAKTVVPKLATPCRIRILLLETNACSASPLSLWERVGVRRASQRLS